MDYESIQQAFIDYSLKCKQKIIDAFFTSEDIDSLIVKKKEDNIDAIVKRHRLKMIDIKVDHTLRMIEQIININATLGFKVNMDMVIKVATLYHDIGRLRQATWSNTFADNRAYKNINNGFVNHAEEGYNIFLNNNFNVEQKYIPAISETILHHQDSYLYEHLNKKSNKNLKELDIDKILTGKFNLNEAEWTAVSIMVQLVADVDKSDILYQHLLEDFDMIRDHINDSSGHSLDERAKYWQVSKKEILDFNHLTDNDEVPARVLIPIENMPLEKLKVPSYMKDMFYNNSWLELKDLIKDRNWTFITILWWRLSHFLNQITFTSTLINIEETNLLDQIYNKIPNKLKPLVTEAFLYAKEQLISETLKVNKENIYIQKKAR